MNKQEFIKLFELEKIYAEYRNNIPFGLVLLDHQTGTENAVFFIFDENKVKIVVESEDFNEKRKKQRLEVHVILFEHTVYLNKDETLLNEIFPLLKFTISFEASLNFIADFINKIFIPKYRLMASVTVY